MKKSIKYGIIGIIPYYCNGNHTYYGEEIYLNSISIGKNDDYILPDITQKEWY